MARAIGAVVPPTADEPGCLGIAAYRALRDAGLFHIHSQWVDEAAFEAHARLAHTVAFLETVAPLIDHPLDVVRSTPLEGSA